MNKHLDSPNFCSTLDGLLPKFKQPRRTDPLLKTADSSKHEKARLKAKNEKTRRKRDTETSGN